MRIIMKENMNISCCDIYIEYHHMNYKKAKEISNIIKMYTNSLIIDEENYSVNSNDLYNVYYIECSNHKIYSCYEKKKKIVKTKDDKMFKENIMKYGFIKINRRIYLNMNYVVSYSIIKGSQRKIKLKNNEELIVSRKYKNKFDEFYKIRE